MKVFEPSLSSGVDTYFTQVEKLCKATAEIAKRRNLVLMGLVGERIRFSPKYFDLVSAAVADKVQVMRPAVIRNGSDGSAEVVVRGLAGN